VTTPSTQHESGLSACSVRQPTTSSATFGGAGSAAAAENVPELVRRPENLPELTVELTRRVAAPHMAEMTRLLKPSFGVYASFVAEVSSSRTSVL
jgi:hypothetical protein